MTKNEYMSRLEEALNDFSEATRREVLEDYEAHFTMGLEAGRSEDEICRELGPIDLFIEELAQMEPKEAAPKTASPSHCAAAKAKETEQARETSDASLQPESYHSDACRKLVLDGQIADVSMSPSEDNNFYIYCKKNGTTRQKMQYQFYFRQEGDTIYTGLRKLKTFNSMFGGFTNPAITLTVLLPAHMDDIDAGTVSGDIEAKNLHSDTLRLHTVSGDINAKKLRSDTLQLNSVSGDMECSDLTAQNLKTSTTSGDCRLLDAAAPSCQLNSVSGDLTLNGRYSFCKANAVSGDIKLTVLYPCELKLNTVSGDIEAHLHGKASGSCNTVSGDVDIDTEDSQSGYEICYSTTSGDFRCRRCSELTKTSKRSGKAVIEGETNGPISVHTTSGDIHVH